MSRHTCHIEILVQSISYPDPDGHGKHGGSKGDIRLIARSDAKAILADAKRDGEPAPIRILSDAESAEIDG